MSRLSNIGEKLAIAARIDQVGEIQRDMACLYGIVQATEDLAPLALLAAEILESDELKSVFAIAQVHGAAYAGRSVDTEKLRAACEAYAAARGEPIQAARVYRRESEMLEEVVVKIERRAKAYRDLGPKQATANMRSVANAQASALEIMAIEIRATSPISQPAGPDAFAAPTDTDIAEARRLAEACSQVPVAETTTRFAVLWASLSRELMAFANSGGLSRLLSLADSQAAEIERLKAEMDALRACLHAKVEFAIEERAALSGTAPQPASPAIGKHA